MRIEQYVVAIVVCAMMMGCGSTRRLEDKERERAVFTEMSGVGVLRGNTRWSEGVRVRETEVQYSLPDSTGEQHVTRRIDREIVIDAEGEEIVEKVDSVTIDKEEVEKEKEETEEDKGYQVNNYIGFLLFGLATAVVLRISFS